MSKSQNLVVLVIVAVAIAGGVLLGILHYASLGLSDSKAYCTGAGGDPIGCNEGGIGGGGGVRRGRTN